MSNRIGMFLDDQLILVVLVSGKIPWFLLPSTLHFPVLAGYFAVSSWFPVLLTTKQLNVRCEVSYHGDGPRSGGGPLVAVLREARSEAGRCEMVKCRRNLDSACVCLLGTLRLGTLLLSNIPISNAESARERRSLSTL